MSERQVSGQTAQSRKVTTLRGGVEGGQQGVGGSHPRPRLDKGGRHHRESYYRVRSLNLSSGEIFDTFGRGKSLAEDMAGQALHAVLSPDGR